MRLKIKAILPLLLLIFIFLNIVFVNAENTREKASGEIINPFDIIPQNNSYIYSNLAQSKEYGGKHIKIAVFDTGIDTKNTDLKIAGGISFVDGVSSYADDNGHGTAIASILSAAKNNSGSMGVAPDISLYSVKVLDRKGVGTYSNIIKGIEWAIDNDMDIISMSFGGTQYSKKLEDALLEADKNNILVIAAAGNEGSNQIDYPARYHSVVSVGAIDNTGKIASFSNSGPELDLAAPGIEIAATTIGNKNILISGTSAAVPHVTTVAAQLLTARAELMVNEIKSIMHQSATLIPETSKFHFGQGITNASDSYENMDSSLKLGQEQSYPEFAGEDAGLNGTVSASYKIFGDNETISSGQTAQVRAGFYSKHSQCIMTVENTSGTVLYTETRAPIYGNAYVTFTTPVFNNPGTYKVRYYCPDNGTHRYDDIFTINVSPAATPPPVTDDRGNDFATAYNVGVIAGSTVSIDGMLEIPDDVDFYKFTAPVTGVYTIYSSGRVDLKGWLYNSSKTELAYNDDSRGTLNFTISSPILSKGQVYYIKTNHFNLNGIGDYTLNISAPDI